MFITHPFLESVDAVEIKPQLGMHLWPARVSTTYNKFHLWKGGRQMYIFQHA
jgi:hypothetical protein